jgi:hypothetical protein
MLTILAIAALASTASVVNVNPVAAPICQGTHCGSLGS